MRIVATSTVARSIMESTLTVLLPELHDRDPRASPPVTHLHGADSARHTDFRRVSQRAIQMIDLIPQYRRIIRYTPASIQGCLSIGAGRLFSCQNLYEKLCTAECDICGDVGGYLYLITCRQSLTSSPSRMTLALCYIPSFF